MQIQTDISKEKYIREVIKSGNDIINTDFPNTNSITFRYLNLSNSPISKLPFNLPNLTHLILQNCSLSHFTNQIEISLLNYHQLIYLDLSNNNFHVIPSFFRKQGALQTLNLSSNPISNFDLGTHDTDNNDKDNNKCTYSFQELILNNCNFHTFPSLSLEYKLKSLSLNQNHIKTINCSNNHLVELFLSRNYLQEIHPSCVFQNLISLDISKNKLSFLPSLSSLAPNLCYLDASQNFLQEFPILPISISTIFISHNSITEISETLSEYINLVSIDASYNFITRIPHLPISIQEANFFHNRIVVIEESITPHLVNINVASNMISQTPHLANNKVFFLDLHFNAFFSLPHQLLSPQLRKLCLRGCKILSIPDSISQCNLYELDISFNLIHVLPGSIGSNRTLTTLNISCNSLDCFPAFLPSNLEQFYASYCHLSEAQIEESSKLTLVDLSGNNLSTIPYISTLQILRLSRNKFSKIPFLPSTIQIIDLSHNQIQSLNNAFKDNILENLQSLNLSNNKISQLPEFDQYIPNLRHIIIYGNPISSSYILPLLQHHRSTWFSLQKVTYKSYSITYNCPSFPLNDTFSLEFGIFSNDCFYIRDDIPFLKIFSLMNFFETYNKNCQIASKIDEAVQTLIPSSKSSLIFNEQIQQRINDVFNVFFSHYSLTYHMFYFGLVILTKEELLMITLGSIKILVFDQLGKVRLYSQKDEIYHEKWNEFNADLSNLYTYGEYFNYGNYSNQNENCIFTPHFQKCTLKYGDKWLLMASEILFSYFSIQQLEEMIRKANSPFTLAADIRNIAASIFKNDNFGVIVIDLFKNLHK